MDRVSCILLSGLDVSVYAASVHCSAVHASSNISLDFWAIITLLCPPNILNSMVKTLPFTTAV